MNTLTLLSAGADKRRFFLFPGIRRWFLVIAVGTGLGLLVWQLADLLNWNKNIAGLADLSVSAIPVLAIMWSLGLITCCILLIVPSTRPLGARCLAGSLTLWLCMTLVAAGVQFSHGTSYTSHIEIVIGAAYLSSGLTFGLVLVPLLVTRLAWFGIAKYRSLQFCERIQKKEE